jgi:hypothetical protein
MPTKTPRSTSPGSEPQVQRNGQALIELLKDPRLEHLKIEHEPTHAPVRSVDL